MGTRDLALAVNPIDAGGPHQADSPALPKNELDKEVVERRALPDAQHDPLPANNPAHGHEHDHDMSEEHSKIGVSLVTGFIFMLLVDQIGGSMHSHGGPSVSSSSSPSDMESAVINVQNRNKMTATLGLVVHAAGELCCCF